MIKRIESSQNKLLKEMKSLGLRKNRDKLVLFVAEGVRFVSEIPDDWNVRYYIASESFLNENDTETYERRAVVYCIADEMFSALSDTESPQGILAVCEKRTDGYAAHFACENPFFLVCENLQDPGNLGAIIRTADACGVDAVFLSKGTVDVYNPKVLRATMGSIFHLPIVEGIVLSELTKKFKEKNISLYAAHLSGEILPYDLPLREGCAFLVGNEGHGLTGDAVDLCERLVKIPMPGQAESLNAAVAAGILMYEVLRQRLSE